MEYGWVNLNTSQRGGRVSTPRAEARVAQRDRGGRRLRRERASTGRFVGLPRLARRRVAGRARAPGRSPPAGHPDRRPALRGPPALPAAPKPERAGREARGQLDATRSLVARLGAGRRRVALCPPGGSRNRLFVDNVIDVDARTRTRPRSASRGRGASCGGSRRSRARVSRGRGARRAPSASLAARNPGERGRPHPAAARDRRGPGLRLDLHRRRPHRAGRGGHRQRRTGGGGGQRHVHQDRAARQGGLELRGDQGAGRRRQRDRALAAACSSRASDSEPIRPEPRFAQLIPDRTTHGLQLAVALLLQRSRDRPRHRQHPGLRPQPGHRGARAVDRRAQQADQPASRRSARKPRRCWAAPPATSRRSGR